MVYLGIRFMSIAIINEGFDSDICTHVKNHIGLFLTI